MSFSPIQNALSTTLTFFEDQVIKPLTVQQKKIALIALVIFSALAAASYVIYRCFFNAKKIESSEDEVDLKKSPKKSDEVDPKKSPKKSDEVDSSEGKEVDPKIAEAKKEIEKNGLNLEHYPQYQDNPSLVELAIKHSKGWAIQFAEAFKDNDKMLDLAIDGNPYVVQFASERYRGDYDKMAPLVTKDGLLAQYATKELREKRSFAKLSVENDWRALEFLEDFKDDEEIVNIAYKQNSKAIKYASDRFQQGLKIPNLLVEHDVFLELEE